MLVSLPDGSSAKTWPHAVAAVLLLGAAAPPGAFAGAGCLVLLGLAALYHVVAHARRPAWSAYFVGAAYMAMFSWSLRHIVLGAYVGVSLVGGLYFAVLPLWLRGLVGLRVPRTLAFGAAVAGAAWLRAHMPEIWYPHGQPAHSLYHWPRLTWGVVSLAGEVGANFLLGALAVAVHGVASREQPKRAVATLLALLAPWLLLHWARPLWRAERVADIASAPILDVVAVQPGLTVDDIFERDAGRLRARQDAALVQPTLREAGPRAPAPPDLVLWPESTSFVELLEDANGERQLAVARWWMTSPPLPLASRTKLLLGAHLDSPVHDGLGVAVLLDHRGALLEHQEKQRLVPGGERQPFLGWLPEAWSTQLREAMARALGAAPHLAPGRARAPLRVRDDVRVGALICYDNAFADVARQQVEAGANVLAVLSNEVWYQGGAELDQLAAMTVLRAQETGVPVVRATVDGWTMAVGSDGGALGSVPIRSQGTLRIRVPLPSTAGPGAPAAPLLALLCAVSLVFAIAQRLWAWATLRRSQHRTFDPGATGKMPVVGA